MSDSSTQFIKLRGLRQNNLKNFDLDLPLKQLIVITGLSGSGKSSLAFDTLFAEGQRRYIETFSPYARQFLDRMDKPQADHIEGIPPAIAVEQRNSVKSTRSTIGTMTELTDYTKVFWSLLSRLYCRNCGQLVEKDAPQKIWDKLLAEIPDDNVLITFQIALSDKFPIQESLQLIERQGYQRLWLEGKIVQLNDAAPLLTVSQAKTVTVVQDRVSIAAKSRARFVEACEQAYHFGSGFLAIYPDSTLNAARKFSNKFHCAACEIDYREPVAALFSFNHPTGACPACRGFGRIIAINYDAATPDRTKTIAGGVVKPWQTGQGAECQDDMMKFAKKRKAPVDVPFAELPKKWQDWVIEGDPGYGSDEDHKWPQYWYGIKGYFRWLESKSYKMHVRVLLSRYRKYETCPQCHGARFQPETLYHRIGGAKGSTISDFYALSVTKALRFVDELLAGRNLSKKADPVNLALQEVRSRLHYLEEVGLGYLTLDRTTRTLSGGETERVNLTTCVSSRLVNTLFVLDEPSVGLHARDTSNLIRILERLRDAGNTVVVVEHESSVMRAADQIIDLGPGHGEAGGQLVFQGPLKKLLQSKVSLTGQYLSGRKKIETPKPRPVPSAAALVLEHARSHNLDDLTVKIPLGRFVCLTGVSGSGKTTLLREELLPALESGLRQQQATAPTESSESENESETEQENTFHLPSSSIRGLEALSQVVFVDQSSLGKTPRSNPAVYIGAFEDIRTLFAASEQAKQRGLNASAFSFNSGQGQCERCRGVGFEKIEMQFLSDIFIRCPDCQGRRYRQHILEIKIKGTAGKAWSIGDMLEATVDEAIVFLEHFSASAPAQRAVTSLKLLQEVGLGYLRVGQPINTLSGGESQRLKLVGHLAAVKNETGKKPILFMFDEPTTGLHFDDIRLLLNVFHRLVDAGHSVFVVEHNLDVIKCADWIIDLGPEAGESGGKIVAQGTPKEVMNRPESHTGRALLQVA